MNKLSLIIISVFFAYSALYAQEANYNDAKKAFDLFENDKFIELSDSLLIKRETLPDSLVININMMRAQVFYSLNDEKKWKQCFYDILKIDNNYSCKLAFISPKIIELFKNIKSEYNKTLQAPESLVDSTKQEMTALVFDKDLFESSVIKNIFVPGWGQIYSGNTTKGIILTAVSTALLGTSIYSIIDANKKENDYLKEVNKNIIGEKYSAFNNAYKLKNILIASYAAVWLICQLDLYFNSDEENFMKKIFISPTNSGINTPAKNDISFSLSFQF